MSDQTGIRKEVASKQEATVRDFLNVVFHRKYLIIAIVVITTVLVLLLNTMQPQVFESSARILISRGQRSSALTAGVRYLSWEEEISSQIEVILSETVFKRAREIFADSVTAKGLPDVMVFNPGSVRADVIGESNVLVIRYTDLDPNACGIGCAAVTEAYAEYYKIRKAPPELTDFFAGEIQDVQREMEHWRQKKNEFLNKEKFFGMDEEGRFMLDILSNLEKRLSSAKGDISYQRSKIENIKKVVDLADENLEKNLALSTAPPLLQTSIIINIKLDLQKLRFQQEELKSKYTSKHPRMMEIRKQIADLLRSLKAEVGNLYKVEEAALEQLMARQATIEDDLRKAQLKIDAIPDKEMKLSEIKHKIDVLENKYKSLLERQDQVMITMASSPEWDVVILTPASAPYQKKTKDYVRLALGPFLSLVVALGLAFFLESLDHSLHNAAEVEEYLGANVLTIISDIKSGN